MTRIVRIIGLALAGVLAFTAPAFAHSQTLETSPESGATLAILPDSVTITLDEKPMDLGHALVVTGPDGVAVSDPEPIITGHSISAPIIADGPAGEYKVGYRVVSSDGHVVTGSYTFTVTSGRPVEPVVETQTAADENSVTAIFAVFSLFMMAAFVTVAVFLLRRRHHG